jgi:hypothetical protein
MVKPSVSLEYVSKGLTVTVEGGVTSVIRSDVSTTPVDACVEQSRKLYALTHLLTADGFSAFQDLVDDDQQTIVQLIRDLAAEVAALAETAQEIELNAIREARNG